MTDPDPEVAARHAAIVAAAADAMRVERTAGALDRAARSRLTGADAVRVTAWHALNAATHAADAAQAAADAAYTNLAAAVAATNRIHRALDASHNAARAARASATTPGDPA